MTARLATLAILVALGTVAAGCGGSSDNGVASQSASTILAASRAAAHAASSVRIVSRARVGPSKFTYNASLSGSASYAHVSLYGMNFEAIRDGSTLYIKGNRDFVSSIGESLGVEIPATAWIKGSTSGRLGQVDSFTDIKTEVPLALRGAGALTKGATTTIAGQPAIEVKQARKLATVSLYIATIGKPYPLLLRKIGRETGQTTFSDWNQPVHVDLPANAVDIDELAKVAG